MKTSLSSSLLFIGLLVIAHSNPTLSEGSAETTKTMYSIPQSAPVLFDNINTGTSNNVTTPAVDPILGANTIIYDPLPTIAPAQNFSDFDVTKKDGSGFPSAPYAAINSDIGPIGNVSSFNGPEQPALPSPPVNGASGNGAQVNGSFGQGNSSSGRGNCSSANRNGSLGQANTSFGQANTSFGQANTSFGQANASFGQANISFGQANASFGQANTSFGQANTSFGQANSSFTNQNGSFGQGNSSFSPRNGSFGQLNGSFGQGNGSFGQGNASFGQANASFGQANSSIGQGNSTHGGHKCGNKSNASEGSSQSYDSSIEHDKKHGKNKKHHLKGLKDQFDYDSYFDDHDRFFALDTFTIVVFSALILGLVSLSICLVACYKSNQHDKFKRRLELIRGALGAQNMVFIGNEGLSLQNLDLETGNRRGRRSFQYYVNTLQQRMMPRPARLGAVQQV